MSKVESLMGTGTLQPLKTGFFGGAKSFQVKYQFQLTSEESGQSGQLDGFVRVEESQRLSPGANYTLTTDDNRKVKLLMGKAVASVSGIITYSISGEIVA